MRKITFSDATREAMEEEMTKYPEVFVMGEDIARQGGIFGQFKYTLLHRFMRLSWILLLLFPQAHPEELALCQET